MAVSLTTKLSSEASYLAYIKRLHFVSVQAKTLMWRDFTRRAQCGVKNDLNFRFRKMKGLVSKETYVLPRRGSETKIRCETHWLAHLVQHRAPVREVVSS